MNAKLKTRLSKRLDNAFFMELSRHRSLPEMIGQLRNTSFAYLSDIYHQTGDLGMCELALFREELSSYKELEKMAPLDLKLFLTHLKTLYEIENLKSLLRLWFCRWVLKREQLPYAQYLYRDQIVHSIPVEDILQAEDPYKVIDLLSETPYQPALNRGLPRALSEGSLFYAEWELDRWYFIELHKQASQLNKRDVSVALRYVGAAIDRENLNYLIRINALQKEGEAFLDRLIPNGLRIHKKLVNDLKEEEKSDETQLFRKFYPEFAALMTSRGSRSEVLDFLEQADLNYREKEARRALHGDPFSIGVLLSYCFYKRLEMEKLLMLLNGGNLELDSRRMEALL